MGAQGLTSAALEGGVVAEDGTPIESAAVTLVNLSTGARWVVATGASGRYLFESLEVGGPYVVTASALGFAAEERSDVVLSLGRRFVADFVLVPQPIELPGVEVTASGPPGARGFGVGTLIRREQIEQLPNPGRDFLGLLTLSTLVAISPSSGSAPSGGITIAGQNRLYNAFQIDGGLNHDLYEGRLAGRETLPRPIALDALEEIQVLAAPFDVRYGGFAGGLVNAVTKSGTNELHGSGFAFLSDAALVGDGGATGGEIDDFTTWGVGWTLGGPIVRDRAHFFVSVDLQHEVVPDPGPILTDLVPPLDVELVGVSRTDALRFQTLLDSLGLNPGSLGPVAGNIRSTDLFGKLTVQLGTNGRLELSHHYTHGDRWGFVTRSPSVYFLSTADQHDPSTVQASRAIWTALLANRWSNELIVSALRLEDECRPTAEYTQIRVRGVTGDGDLVAGADAGCPLDGQYAVVQDALDITDNLTMALGAHTVTLGVHGEVLRFQDSWLQAASGRWVFINGLAAFESGTVNRFERALPGPSWEDGLDFRAGQIGLYAQDRWKLGGLTLTLGLRADLPILPDGVAANDSLDAALGIRTGRPPAEHVLWSPRLGFTYELPGARSTVLKGGVGLFTGPPPYRWLANAYRDDGTRELFLDCAQATGRPRPAFDPLRPPSTCGDGSGPVPRLSSFAPETRFPQSVRMSLGADRELVRGLVASADVLYTRAIHQLAVRDANLAGVQLLAEGEANRPLYGSAPNAPTRVAPTFGRVLVVENGDGDHAWSLTLRLRHALSERLEWDAAYAFTRSRDRASLVNGGVQQQFENTASDGPQELHPLRTSYFEIPHRVQLGVTWLPGFDTNVSILYSGSSGTPFTYVVSGGGTRADVNADGVPPLYANDPVYIPRDRADIEIDGNGVGPLYPGVGTAAEQDSLYAEIESRIQSEECLRRQRGQLLKRNSCRNPWFGTVSARITKGFALGNGRSFVATADVYNLFALLGLSWGERRLTSPDVWWQGPGLAGWNATAGRGIYATPFREPFGVDDLASRWRTEITLRYAF